ncbi:hypothetical protein Cadr_000007688 [Camelus dromedarius]|uniref:Uncharacterized protein n=1 Tax=Camelus dromedarius TaxID=9838 RepID=A0A5N4DXR1_CAMDR|nr:hypothetical protein Cadr_000007688 [Camelus dromedarius]
MTKTREVWSKSAGSSPRGQRQDEGPTTWVSGGRVVMVCWQVGGGGNPSCDFPRMTQELEGVPSKVRVLAPGSADKQLSPNHPVLRVPMCREKVGGAAEHRNVGAQGAGASNGRAGLRPAWDHGPSPSNWQPDLDFFSGFRGRHPRQEPCSSGHRGGLDSTKASGAAGIVSNSAREEERILEGRAGSPRPHPSSYQGATHVSTSTAVETSQLKRSQCCGAWPAGSEQPAGPRASGLAPPPIPGCAQAPELPT